MADKNFGVKGINFISDPGTPTISIASSTITYAGSLNLNANTVAISTNVSIGGSVVSNIIVSDAYSVGIGTTNPTSKLWVQGDVRVSGTLTATSFVGSGASLTGLVSNQLVSIDDAQAHYILLTKSQSGTSSTVSSSYNYIYYNPNSKRLGIGTDSPTANLDVNGTGRFIGTITAPTFQGTATTATTAVGLGTTSSINTSGIITATGGFSIGIQSGGTNITTGVITAINFVGSGNTFSYNSTTKVVDVTISGSTSGSGISSVSISTNTTNQAQYIPYATSFGNTTGFGATTLLVYNPSSGNLGIGTTNPTTRISIAGTTGISFGDTNIRLGDVSTGSSITTGVNNFFAGVGAGKNNSTGNSNNFLGFEAGYYNTGSHNNFFGQQAGQGNTGLYNNFFGQFAGYQNSGSNNNFLGYAAGYFNNGGNNNFIGNFAGYTNLNGTHNNFFGQQAGYYNNNGRYNNFFGYQAGYSNTSGFNNIAIGYSAGYLNQTGSQNVVIGYNQQAPILDGSNQLVIGAGNTAWITGNSSYNVGIGTTNPTSRLSVVGDGNFTGIITATGGFVGGLTGTASTATTALGFSTTASINTTGIITASTFVGGLTGTASTATNLANASGITTGIIARERLSGTYDINISGTLAITGEVFDNLTVTGFSTFTDGPVVIGSGIQTGTSKLQVSGDTFITGSVGIGTTNPRATLNVVPTATSIAGLFSGTTSSDMVRITQLGTGNALVVEDSANPDSNPFVVDTSGSVGIGTTRAFGNKKLSVFGGAYIRDNINLNKLTNILVEGFGGDHGDCSIEFISADAQNGNGKLDSSIVFYHKNNQLIDYTTFTIGSGGITTPKGIFSDSIGIGTTNPTTRISIAGTTGISFADSNIRLGDADTGSSLVPTGDPNITNNGRGTNNFFAGLSAGKVTTTGYYNNFIGWRAGYANTSGYSNNFIGVAAGYANTSGRGNDFIGGSAGFNNTTGNANLFIGGQAGQSNTTGSNNIFVGLNAGLGNQTGSQNVVIGSNQQNTPILNGSNQLVIGAGSTAWIHGNSSYNVGFGTTNPTAKVHIGAATTSDPGGAPLKIGAGTTILTTPEAGAIEYDGTVATFTPNTSLGRAVIATPVFTSGASTSSNLTLNTNTPLFPTNNDTITLPIGTYLVETEFQVTVATSTVSSTVRLNISGGGNAVGTVSWTAHSSITAGGASNLFRVASGNITANATVTASSAVAGRVYIVHARGIMKITTAGTIIPSIQWGATLTSGSLIWEPSNFMVITPLATSATTAFTGAFS